MYKSVSETYVLIEKRQEHLMEPKPASLVSLDTLEVHIEILFLS